MDDINKICVGRLAPSPSGRMHAGNIFAALMCWLIVKSQGGRIVLRIEDLDVERSKREFIDAIPRDFELLGISWDEGPYYQSSRNKVYEDVFDDLVAQGLIYPCFCSRADLHSASAPHRGEKHVYPGTCRLLSEEERRERSLLRKPAYRLIVPDERIIFDDLIQGTYEQDLQTECGDFIVRRSDGLFAYQLAVVVDDIAQGVNCVVRGVDLLCSTPQQIYFQRLLGAQTPTYAHIPLIVSASNRRLSKRDKDASLDEMLSYYGTPEAVIGHIAYITGLIEREEACTCEDLLADFDLNRIGSLFEDKIQILWR